MSTLAENRKALHDYSIIQEYEAGIVLSGQEVKAARAGNISLKGAYVHIKGNQAVLTNAHISPYQKAVADPGYQPTRDRVLLLHKNQFDQIAEKRRAEGLTVVPLKIYTKGDFIKLKLGLAKGKKQYEKRDTIKKRDFERDTKRKYGI